MKKVLFLALCTAISTHSIAQCGASQVEVQIETQTDIYGYEGYWELLPEDSLCGEGTLLWGGNTAVGCTGAGQQNQTPGGYGNNQAYFSDTVCLTDGAAYKLLYIDDWGDGGYEFYVHINGYLTENFGGSGAAHTFDFNAEEPPAYDLTMLHAHVAPYQPQGDIEIEAEVYNGGIALITSLEMHYSIDNGATQSQVISGLSIDNNESGHISHPTAWTPTADGEYDLKIWYTNLNGSNPDENPADDEIETVVNIGPAIPNQIDSYLINLPLVVEIANSSDQINIPTDLDFHPILTKNELWVLNKDQESTGSSTVTITDPGESSQSTWWRRDGNAWHFMSLSTGIAFSENTNFATSPGVFDANHNGGSPFTGPALWSSDPAIYAQNSGGNGSHLDMLHASPECQGIASESGNAFWVVDGYNRDIVRYDFVADHGPGNADHDDGEILRYQEVLINPDPANKVPSHIVYDKETDWVYVVDQGAGRIIRIDATSGSVGGAPAFGPFETLAVYAKVQGYDWEVVVDEDLDTPSGIEIIDDRLLVSDYATGEVIIYDISSLPATEMARLQTGAEGIMGIKLGPKGKIWYVDYDAESVNRIDWVPDTTVGVAASISPKFNVNIWPNPSNGTLNYRHASTASISLRITDVMGKIVHEENHLSAAVGRLRVQLEPGHYLISILDDQNSQLVHKKIIIQ